MTENKVLQRNIKYKEEPVEMLELKSTITEMQKTNGLIQQHNQEDRGKTQ